MIDVSTALGTDIEKLPFWQDRNLSWLSYAQRILDQGADETVPLLERLRFVHRYQVELRKFVETKIGSSADRMAAYRKACATKAAVEAGASDGANEAEDEGGKHPKRHLKRLESKLLAEHERIGQMADAASRTYMGTCDILRGFGIDHIFGERLAQGLPEYQRIFLHDYLQKEVYGYLAPHVIDAQTPFPYMDDATLYIAVGLREKEKGKPKDKKGKKAKADKGAEHAPKLGLVAMPAQCVRLIELPTGKGKNITPAMSPMKGKMRGSSEETVQPFAFVLLEDALCLFAQDIFPNYQVEGAASVALIRNADLDRIKHLDVDDEDYLDELDEVIADREHHDPLMLLVGDGLGKSARKMLQAGLCLGSHQVQRSGLPLDLDYVLDVPDRLSETLRARLSWAPAQPKWLRSGPLRLNPNLPIADQVVAHDALLMYPYESMDPFLMLLEEAASDPQVSEIAITIFRLAPQSKVATLLMDAARAGKRVRVVVEPRASRAEEQNAEWARRFEEAGCDVIVGMEDHKVHAKICSITRSVDGALQRITQLGTGNYDEDTATWYTDFCYFTADPDIGSDAQRFFRSMERGEVSNDYRALIVAPLQLQKLVLDEMDAQIERANEGLASGIFFKVNAVTDKTVIAKIVEAAQAGVPVVMIVRDSVCVLPGIEGYTDKVRIASIVGRLREHGRIYGFGAWDDMKIYLSSGDLMTRNMERRVEIAWAITNNQLRKRIIQYANLCLNDTAKLRELLSDGAYTPLGALAKEDKHGRKELFDSQEYLLHKG